MLTVGVSCGFKGSLHISDRIIFSAIQANYMCTYKTPTKAFYCLCLLNRIKNIHKKLLKIL